jgi:hypothetical protein
MTGTPLTDTREELYAQARAKLVPSRAACVHAGYPNAHNAARIEKRPRVLQRIRELRHHDEVDIGWQRRVLRQELMALAMARLPDLFEIVKDDDGKEIGRQLKPLSQWTDDDRAAVAELYTDKDGNDRVKLHSKTSAIELLCKLDGLIEPDTIAMFNQINVGQGSGDGEEIASVKNAYTRIAGRIEQIASRATREPAGA